MKQDNVALLQDTLNIFEQGFYQTGGRIVPLTLTREQREEAVVYLPEEVRRLASSRDLPRDPTPGRCGYGCENEDSFSLARRRGEQFAAELRQDGARPMLVLNLANPVNPGGGIRRGARAQEEDLCRCSSLLLSLESEAASAYYEYNRSLDTWLGSDAVMIHPQVEIIRDGRGRLLPAPAVVAVLTCAAPMLRGGPGSLSREGLTQPEYEELMYRRISGMLQVAAKLGYRYLVLGAFGCGAFRNDAAVVSDLFHRALVECGPAAFRRVDFAVLDRTPEQYNYQQFCRNFRFFYRDGEAAQKAQADPRDAIRGCLFGGAAGDALGYPVEFLREREIRERCGKKGITAYMKDPVSGLAEISDDTQMTLFTANGLLVGETAGTVRGIPGPLRSYVARAYQDWLRTQTGDPPAAGEREGGCSWLLDVPELYSRRAPGTTCLSALYDGREYDDYIAARRNDSKGCGGVMRVAPLALLRPRTDIGPLDWEGAQLAAITHGHSLGYMPAAVLVHIISRLVFPPEGKRPPLRNIVLEARDTAARLFAGDPHLAELTAVIDRAVELAEDGPDSDLDNVRRLGEGWVAEETLGIAIYCALRHQDDFSAGIIAAVNHDGDSDSTGAVTGNILGALLGYAAIPEQWKQDLELSGVILELAEDLARGCPRDACDRDADWEAKYVELRRPARRPAVFFWMDDGENGCFSNWYRRKFVVDDFEYLHMEQYMMAQKARFFHDAASYTAILRATEPAECKRLGRLVTPFDSAAWAAVRCEIVKAGSRAKYEQNPDLRARLLATGDALLAEASPLDRIWGIGLPAEQAERTAPSDWPGQNLLGRILMELRDEFKDRDGSVG